MTLPNFLIIGAAKAGTTALYYYLKQHPEIYMCPVKEPRFFAFENVELHPEHPIHTHTITTLKSYEALFDGVVDEKRFGEASPAYLVEPKAPEHIRHYIPDAKLIAILRNTAERAYSHFLHLIKNNYEPCHDFGHTLQHVNEIVIGNWVVRNDYIQFGFYYDQLQRYFNKFDRNQIKIFLFEDLKSNALKLTQKIFRFLEVDGSFVPDVSLMYNVSGIPKNNSLHTFLSKPNPVASFLVPILKPFFSKRQRERLRINIINKNLHKPQFPLEARNQLIELYREDIMKLQELLQRDLSTWLK